MLTGWSIALLVMLTPWLADELPRAARPVQSARQLIVGRAFACLTFVALLSALLAYQPSIGASLQDVVSIR